MIKTRRRFRLQRKDSTKCNKFGGHSSIGDEDYFRRSLSRLGDEISVAGIRSRTGFMEPAPIFAYTLLKPPIEAGTEGLIDVICTKVGPICLGVGPAGVGTSAHFDKRFS